MPNSFRIKTEIGVNKVLPVKLDQQFDTLEILSLAVFPNDVYTRSCSDFGVLCGRVFANRGFGITNARVSVFIPLEEIDETNPIISTLYPYKRTEDVNEDGYKYNLLPYTQSHSGHVPVGTFPERIDALTNKSVIEVYDKYYKFTAKTNESGDFMIFGLPIGQHNIFMQVDLSDIGEFSLTPQDLVRMGRATETQIDGVKFKFSENYSELPQIVTLEKTIQVAPFYGEKDICDHYIVRTDFDLTTEAGVEFKPTSVFMGSIISHNNRKKLKKRCKIPAKAGWLCELITGPGQIESIRQTIFKDSYGRPILEEFTLENSGKVIDDNGTWVLEVPMNLDYVYTNEDGKKVLSDNPELGVPTKGKYRFKVKWNQSPKVGEENKRGYFLVPNVKEWGWENSDSENQGGSVTNTNWNITSPTKFIADATFGIDPDNPPATGPREVYLPDFSSSIYAISYQSSLNVDSFRILVLNPDTLEYEENPDYKNYIPIYNFTNYDDILIEFVAIDPTVESKFTYRIFDEGQFKQECSYTFSLNWADYGTQEMIDEAVNCEDRFYQMSYNKVYTVSQLIDRFAWQTFPQKAVEIKHITESKCEGDYNPFPANDVYYRYDIMFLILSFVMNFIILPVLIAVIGIFHVLAWLFDIFISFYPTYCSLRNKIRDLKCALNNIPLIGNIFSCPPPINCADLPVNPFKNLRLGVFLYTDDGCERCKCNISELPIPPSAISNELASYDRDFGNTSAAPDFTSIEAYEFPTLSEFNSSLADSTENYYQFIPRVIAGGGGNRYAFNDIDPQDLEATYLLPFAADPLYGGSVLQFSPNLTLGEKLNLFNTKAKYFDAPSSSINNNDSPGNIGWSQIKVTWWPELNYTQPAPTGDINNAFTTKINNENVWVIRGNQTSLNDQTIYIWNNSNSVQPIVSAPNSYYEVKVLGTQYFSDTIAGQIYDYTVLQFSSVTTNEILTAPVALSNDSCFTSSPFSSGDTYYNTGSNCGTTPFSDPGISDLPDGDPNILWDLFQLMQYPPIPDGVFRGNNPDLTTLLNSTIWVKGSGTLGTPYYYVDDTDNILYLSPSQYIELKVNNVSRLTQSAGNTTWVFWSAELADPITGVVVKPYAAYKRFNIKKNSGISFSWSATPPPNTYNIFHLDNALVLLLENNAIETGDLITFQDPSLSTDPNVSKPVGRRIETIGASNSITVKYCNPNKSATNLTQGGNLETTYIAPVFGKEGWVSPFPRDIEYFQAVSVIDFPDMVANRAPLNVTGNNRFSLPWRFLDSSNGKSIKQEIFQQAYSFTPNEYLTTIDTEEYEYALNNGAPNYGSPNYRGYSFVIKGPGGYLHYDPWITTGNLVLSNPTGGYIRPPIDGQQVNFRSAYEYSGQGQFYTNDFRIYRNQLGDINNTEGITGLGIYNNLLSKGRVVQYSPFTRAFQMASPQLCYESDDQLIGGTTDIWSGLETSRYKIVILQRGVDPHSPKINVRYDLSRLYGYENYEANNGQFIVEGEYRMNIPIQGRENSPGQNPNDYDMLGFGLPKHTNFNNSGQIIEGQRLFYPSYLYEDDLTLYSGGWETNLHTYYSALDSGAIVYQSLWSKIASPGSFAEPRLNISDTDKYGLRNRENSNLFSKTFELEQSGYTIVDQGKYIGDLGLNINGTVITANCQPYQPCSTNTTYGPEGIGMYVNHFADIPSLRLHNNSQKNNVSGYWGNEYVEGASLMGCLISNRIQNPPDGGAGVPTIVGSKIGGTQYYPYICIGPSCSQKQWFADPVEYTTFQEEGYSVLDQRYLIGTCNDCEEYGYEVGSNNLSYFEYFSPTYRTIPYDVNAAANWANPEHTLNMTSSSYIVFRTDRLPTSTSLRQYANNGYLMHQNNTFAIFVLTDEGASSQEGGYELPDQANGAEIDLNELPSENQSIIESLTNCAFAVNLNSYDVDTDGNPYIKSNNPFSVLGNETYFVRGMGCYNFVSVPFGSLTGVPDRFTGGGGDIASAVEWTRRTVLNFSLCFEIYSHTFSNNWINGTLYHYPFQLNTVFGRDNEPVRDYCRHVIYFHEPNQTFYYRSSPWNGTDFIGKQNPGRMVNEYGNDKQLMYPTTILDMGPKTNYLQELVYSDEYDGYIISKIPTTTFNNVNDLLNIFVLSRLVNTNFLQQLIPTNSSGNNEGSDDPSVTGFFKNTRWANGEAFFNNLLPSVVDADYSQMLSINSEFGVKEYGPEVYRNTDIWFINDNNGNSVFGITMKSDNQDRDYISPRRTIWNDNSPVPPIPGDFTQIPVNTQKVPSYQWLIRYQYNNTANDPLQYPSIFGMQSNDFWSNAPSPQANDLNASTVFTNGFFWTYYQRLDRFNDSSEYFKTNIDNITKYYKAHIINYEPVVDAAGNIIFDSLGNVSAYTETADAPIGDKRRYAYTFGAPFHFYFGLIQGASAMDTFRTKYVDTNIQYE
jgi:hypothetical protein